MVVRPMSGSTFREVSGLPALRGASVRSGLLFRGGSPATLTPAERALLGGCRLRTRIDLRTSGEVAAENLPGIDGIAPGEPAVRLEIPLVDPILAEWANPVDQRPEAIAQRYLAMLDAAAPAMARTIAALSDPANLPAFVHCAAGRDRTGLVVAILLDLLGVPRSLIAAEYARSAGTAQAETMERVLEGVHARHGTSSAFLCAAGSTETHHARVAAWLLDAELPLEVRRFDPSAAGDLALVPGLTRLLHRAFQPMAAAGMRYHASHQDDATTLDRLEEGLALVAFAHGVAIATATLQPPGRAHGTPWYDRTGVAPFGQYAVEPSLQGRGIGRRLLHELEALAAACGAQELACDTSVDAADLIAMYERHGFRRIEEVQWKITNYRSVVLSKSLP